MDKDKNPADVVNKDAGQVTHAANSVRAVVEMPAEAHAGRMAESGKVAKMQAEMDDLKAKFAAVQAERDQFAAEKKAIEDEKVIDQFVATGKSTKAMREPEITLYASLSDDQRKLFAAYKEAQPQIWHPGTRVEAQLEKPGEPDKENPYLKLAREDMKARGVQLADTGKDGEK